MQPEDFRSDPAWKRVEKEIRDGSLKNVARSDVFIAIVPPEEIDIYGAAEIGFSVMLNKPILTVCMPGRTVPEKLAIVSDEVVHADPTTESGRKVIEEALLNIFKKIDHREPENG